MLVQHCWSRCTDTGFRKLKFASAVGPAVGAGTDADCGGSAKMAESHEELKSIGSIVIHWQACECSEELCPIRAGKSLPQAVLPPSKKFHEFGSTSTESGDTVAMRAGVTTLCSWDASAQQKKSLTLRYDSAASVMLKVSWLVGDG